MKYVKLQYLDTLKIGKMGLFNTNALRGCKLKIRSHSKSIGV